MELQPEGIGAIGRARQPVRGHLVLQILDVVFGLPALLIPVEDLRRAAAPVGDQEAEIEAVAGALDFGHHAAGTLPAPRVIREAGVEPDALLPLLPELLGLLAVGLDEPAELLIAPESD